MATVTPINRPKGQCRAGLSAALDYVMQEKKTEFEGRQLVTGVNCQPEICYTQFISTKLQYGKCDGKMYFHFVQSFHPDENITPEKAHAVALELAQQWKDYEVIVATHTDAEHIHSHFIINSVSFENGRKLHFEKDDLVRIMSPEGKELGVGRTAYASEEAREVIGRHDCRPIVHYDYLYLE